MEMMNSIAQASMSMSAANFEQQYSISVMKKSMDSAEQEMDAILDMLPQQPKGQYIDVYA